MASRRWRVTLGAGACVLGLLLSACGEEDGESDGGGGSPHGPLAEFLGWSADFSAPEEMAERESRRQYRVEELVAECMAGHGFEYLPQRPDDRSATTNEEYDRIMVLQREDPERFAKEYGYGMTTMPEIGGSAGVYEDPNWEIRESLSPEEREAYDRALWGEWPEVQDGEAATEPENPGCYSQASDQVYGSGADYERWESINQQINELYERIESDPRVLAATEARSECMAEAGFPGMTEIYSGSETVSERRAAMTREGDSLAGESPLSTAPPEPDAQRLAELQEFERTIGYADYRCRREHYDPVRSQVRDEFETEFIEAHRAELEAYRDWLAGMADDSGE